MRSREVRVGGSLWKTIRGDWPKPISRSGGCFSGSSHFPQGLGFDLCFSTGYCFPLSVLCFLCSSALLSVKFLFKPRRLSLLLFRSRVLSGIFSAVYAFRRRSQQ